MLFTKKRHWGRGGGSGCLPQQGAICAHLRTICVICVSQYGYSPRNGAPLVAEIARSSVIESQNAYNIAKAQFDAGAIDYLNLLDTQRSLYLAQDSQIAINQAQLQSFVLLRKAMGS